MQPAIIDNCRDAHTGEKFQDVVCSVCSTVIATCKYFAPQREWIGLTEEEIVKIVDRHTIFEDGYETWCDGTGVANSVTAALKEKNHIANAGNMVVLEKENAEIKKQLEQTAMALNEQVELNKYLEKKT
jgi:hypothetical protein